MSENLLRKHNIRLNKDLGQHFLTDKNILGKIVDAGNITKDDLVLEVGTGIGTLTKLLAQKAGFVVTAEIDRRFIPAIKEYLKDNNNVEVVNKDILKIDIDKTLGSHKEYKRRKVVANLPYYITSPMIARLLEGKTRFDAIILTIQKEVAERIVSRPGRKQYGSFSIFVNYYAKPRILFDIPSASFMPEPKVDSCVIELEMLDKPSVEVSNEKLFFKVIRAAFIQRRKMLKNAIENANIQGINKEDIAKALELSGIDGKRRGETLSLEEFAKLSSFLSGRIS